MNRNRIIKKAAVLGLSAALCANQVMYAMPSIAQAREISKQESVFVNLDATGKTSDITVTDWIRNVASSKAIKDSSALQDIYNVKGEETFTQNGEAITWAADNEDIYYQGKIQKELPVTMQITYRLDGKEIAPEELKGKNGKFEMEISFENHAKKKVTVDGKDLEVNVPFAMLTGVILPTEHFRNVEIDHGKIMSDADKNMVVGIALPGWKESLQLPEDMEKDVEIPSSLTITADAQDFEMGPVFTLATTEMLNDLDIRGIDSLNELKNSMDELKDASGELVEGSEELADGVGVLKDKSGDFTKGIGSLTDGLKQLHQGAGSLESGIKSYTAGANELAAGVKKLGSSMKGLPEKLTDLSQGISSAKSGADELTGSAQKLAEGMQAVNGGIDAAHSTLSQVTALLGQVEGAEQNEQLQMAIQTLNALVETTGEEGSLKGGAQAVENGFSQLQEGQKTLAGSLHKMEKGISSLSGGKESSDSLSGAMEQLTAGADKLSKNSKSLIDGARSISDAASKLYAGGNKLDDGAGALINGIDDLKDGSVKLKDGMKEFDEEGIRKLYDLVNRDLDKVLNRLDAISKAGADYKSFAGINEEMDGCVRFIMETAEIK